MQPRSPRAPAGSPWLLALAALGVVYGDIGTSPLYAFRECFRGLHPVAADPLGVLGVLSLILWSLIVVVTLKYLVLVMRADNEGEGGILALAALVMPADASSSGRRGPLLLLLGLFGAALLYGDGMITPAISVLSAIEGLEIAAPALDRWVEPITAVLLVAPVILVLLAVDLSFFAANTIKIPDGGWFPLLVGALLLTVMSTWRRGRSLLATRLRASAVPFEEYLALVPSPVHQAHALETAPRS